MATAASSSNSATNLTASLKHEQPQHASSEVRESKVVKMDSMDEDSKEVKTEPMSDSKELKVEPLEEDPFDFMDSKEHIEKFKRYEAEAKQYMMAKYFSDKTLFGGNVFDVKMNIDGQTIMASRLPPYQSYLDPASLDKMINNGSSSSAETTAAMGSVSNEKPPPT